MSSRCFSFVLSVSSSASSTLLDTSSSLFRFTSTSESCCTIKGRGGSGSGSLTARGPRMDRSLSSREGGCPSSVSGGLTAVACGRRIGSDGMVRLADLIPVSTPWSLARRPRVRRFDASRFGGGGLFSVLVALDGVIGVLGVSSRAVSAKFRPAGRGLRRK